MNKPTIESKLYMVTGATGFLGNRIVKMLLEEGKRVRVFVRQDYLDDRVEVIKGDLMDVESLRRAIKGVDVVFHTASFISWNPNDNEKLNEINIKANRSIIDACKEFNVSKLIYTSSIDAIYEGKPIKDGDESLPYPNKFIDHYSYTKAVAEKDIIAANDQNGLLTCSLRTAGIYGPGDRTRLPSIIDVLRKGNYMQIGDGKSKFSHVYVDNCAYAHILAEKALVPGSPVCGQCYFITDHEAGYFFDFFKPILTSLGYTIPNRKIPYSLAMILAHISEFTAKMPWNKKNAQPMITKYTVASTALDFSFVHDKATKDFGYEPIVPFDKAIQETISDLRQRGYAKKD
jgi:sterol-4alpha-carboxylate 3-dehydrogenase (decarboxylating)